MHPMSENSHAVAPTCSPKVSRTSQPNLGMVVGYSYASPFRARIGYRFVVEDSVYVLNEMKGRGIGKQLLMTLIDECARLGYRQMVAVIGDSANEGSINLRARKIMAPRPLRTTT